jgi:hypothetical protein
MLEKLKTEGAELKLVSLIDPHSRGLLEGAQEWMRFCRFEDKIDGDVMDAVVRS